MADFSLDTMSDSYPLLLDIKNDFVFKQVFGIEKNKNVLMSFLNAILRGKPKIVDIELEGLYKRVEAIGYKLVMDEEARQFLAKKGYDIQYGARPLKRAIQTHVEDALAEVILGGEIQEGNTIRGEYDKEKDAIVMTIEH